MSTVTLPSDLSEPARDFLSRPHNHLIGGESAPAADGRTFKTLDPTSPTAGQRTSSAPSARLARRSSRGPGPR
jgi:hypothetical protein